MFWGRLCDEQVEGMVVWGGLEKDGKVLVGFRVLSYSS